MTGPFFVLLIASVLFADKGWAKGGRLRSRLYDEGTLKHGQKTPALFLGLCCEWCCPMLDGCQSRHGGHTDEGGGAGAEAGEGQQAVAHLLHADEDIALRVQEGRNHAQAGALQHLHVHRHALGVALHCPHLQTVCSCLIHRFLSCTYTGTLLV